jgi:hypothetical protein
MLHGMSATQTSRKTDFRPAIPRRLRPIQDQGGRGTGYQRTFPRIALGASLLGAKATDLAQLFDVSEPTIYAWRKAYPAFDKAIREGSQYADAKVAASLYQRAIGLVAITKTTERRVHKDSDGNVLSTTEITVVEERQVPPDANACWRWLQRRRGWGLEQEELTIEDATNLITAAQAEARRRGIDFSKDYEEALATAQRRPVERCPECGAPIYDAMPDEAIDLTP